MEKEEKGDGLMITVTHPHISRYPLHSHPEWEFLYYRRGTGVLKTEKEAIPFAPGTFLFVPPFVWHGSFSEDGFEDVCITLEGFHPADSTGAVLRGTDEKGTLRHLCDAAADLFLSGSESESARTRTQALARDVSVSVLRLAEMTVFGKTDSRPARPVKDAIDRGYAYPDFDLNDVIRRTGYAPNYVRDVFRKDYGETPLGYLTLRRIRYACRLLSHFGSELSVSEVAYRSGFSDPLYFSRLFRKHMGVSPRDYRKEERKHPHE